VTTGARVAIDLNPGIDYSILPNDAAKCRRATLRMTYNGEKTLRAARLSAFGLIRYAPKSRLIPPMTAGRGTSTWVTLAVSDAALKRLPWQRPAGACELRQSKS